MLSQYPRNPVIFIAIAQLQTVAICEKYRYQEILEKPCTYLVGEPLVGEHLPRVDDDGESEDEMPHDLEGPHRADHLRHRVAVERLLEEWEVVHI